MQIENEHIPHKKAGGNNRLKSSLVSVFAPSSHTNRLNGAVHIFNHYEGTGRQVDW